MCLCLFYWQSCKKKEQYDCTQAVVRISPYVAFVGYTKGELDTIVIRAYSPDGTFANLTSSTEYTPVSNYTPQHDTIYYQWWAFPLTSGSDYELEIKKTLRVYRISQIIYKGSTMRHYVADNASCYVRSLGNAFSSPDSVTLDNQGIDLNKTNGALYLHR